ncbi:MAG: ABC transporter substrate-binding protein [Planctomycetaceae bacterium]|nr:ABC transporter substrate-binding protein [Planctomycetaceae bacterium]
MKILSVLFPLLFSVFCAAISVFAEEPAKTDVIRFGIHWQPQSQFAGVLVAVEKGFFQKYVPNKKVEITLPGTSKRAIAGVGTGNIDFSTCWFPDALYHQMLNPSSKIVLLSQVTYTTPLMLVAHRGDGIRTPSDLNGRRVQTWLGNDIMVKHFLQKFDIRPVHIPQGSSMTPFLYRSVDVACAMYYNEYHTLTEHGLKPEDIQVIRLREYGFDFPGDGIYCHEKTFREQPELCKGVIAAVQDGWKFAIDEKNEAETLRIVTKYIKEADTISSKSHQRWMLRTFKLDLTAPYGGDAESSSDILQETDFDRILNIFKNADELKDEKNIVFPKYTDFYPYGKK